MADSIFGILKQPFGTTKATPRRYGGGTGLPPGRHGRDKHQQAPASPMKNHIPKILFGFPNPGFFRSICLF
jgi:hypothetical protein